MKALSVFLTLCTVLSLSRAASLNSTSSNLKFGGLCDYKRQHCTNFYSSFCPSCDVNGNFFPQQCSWLWTERGCWCVDVITGEKIPNTDTPLGTPSAHCDNTWYCPEGWFNFGEKCYTFIDTPKKWLEAEIYCQFDGANLASVHSEEENRFIVSLTRGDTHDFPQTWLGGFDVIHPGYWIWSDGTMFNYKNWNDNQPYGKDDHDNDHNSHHANDDDHDSHHHDNANDDDHDSHHHNNDDDHNSHHHDDDDGHHDDQVGHHHDDDDHYGHQDNHVRHHEDHDNDDDHYGHHDDNDDHDGHHHDHDDHHHDDDNHDDHDHDDNNDHDGHHHDDDDHGDHDSDNDHYHNSHHDDDDHEDEKKNCLRINYDYDLKWFYTSCDDSLPFVCSKKAEAII